MRFLEEHPGPAYENIFWGFCSTSEGDVFRVFLRPGTAAALASAGVIESLEASFPTELIEVVQVRTRPNLHPEPVQDDRNVLRIGASISTSARGSGGRIGFFARLGGDVHACTALHCLGPDEPGKVGIFSPSVHEKRTRQRRLISTSIVSGGRWGDQWHDVCFARLEQDIDFTNDLELQGWTQLKNRVVRPALGQAVFKLRPAIGVTKGIVSATGCTRFRRVRGDVVLERNLFLVTPCEDETSFSTRGDSGSAVVDEHSQLVGLVVGGVGASTVCTSLSFIRERFAFELA